MATYSSILALKIPWIEEPGRLQFMGSQRVRKHWATITTTTKSIVLQLRKWKWPECVYLTKAPIHHTCSISANNPWMFNERWHANEKKNTRKGAQHFKNHSEIPLLPMQMAKCQNTDNIKWCSGSGGSETLQYYWAIVNYCKHLGVLSASFKVDN